MNTLYIYVEQDVELFYLNIRIGSFSLPLFLKNKLILSFVLNFICHVMKKNSASTEFF